jgi:arylsulfatase A-like enzyme
MEMMMESRNSFWLELARVMANCLMLLCVVTSVSEARAADKPNVLFVAVDDLRPQLACYGHPFMKTPHIDELAARGQLFERAYCMVPTCGASRAALMTGIRPARNRFVNYLTWAERDAPGTTTLNTHFKQHGYMTLSNGKVFHHPTDNAQGWSEPAWRPSSPYGGYQLAKNRELLQQLRQQKKRPSRPWPYEAADAADAEYPDAMIATKAIKDLQRLKQQDKPWFLAVGFLKPHLPFVCPQKYWDLYDESVVRIPDNYYVPKNAPPEAVHTFGELRAYTGVPGRGPVSDEMALKLIHGYYACVSFTDAQVGRVVNELDRLEMAENTIIVLWGDHGWQLGEHAAWCKHSCYETSLHAPLIVVAPMERDLQPGSRCAALTEYIDIYPSLCDLAGLPKPEHLEGRSFVPLLRDPKLPWKTTAIGRFVRGDSVRTDRYRYSEYTKDNGQLTGRMLYDHREDPGENVNISEAHENAAVVGTLAEQLHTGMGKPSPER